MRGKPPVIADALPTLRITPAGAGKTNFTGANLSGAKDHPRRCGENLYAVRLRLGCFGSPPQVRGKLTHTVAADENLRITPAGAGKTMTRGNKLRAGQDHPRRCGENALPQIIAAVTTGSPPQVRGKPSRSSISAIRFRITPAGAGKTNGTCCSCGRRRDHPRRCGENVAPRIDPLSILGSPPQVRGKPHAYSNVDLLIRITPAGAGKTQCDPVSPSRG